MDRQEDIDEIARYILAEYGMRAPEVVNERAIRHIADLEIEGALLWSKVAKALGRLRRVSLMRRPPVISAKPAVPLASTLPSPVELLAVNARVAQPEVEELHRASAVRFAAAGACLDSRATRSASAYYREQAQKLRLSSARTRELSTQARSVAARTKDLCATSCRHPDEGFEEKSADTDQEALLREVI